MKRLIQKQVNIFLILLVFFAFTFTFACLAYAGISNTVHNMSTTGTGTIKATSETEICVFCHIPHNAQAGRPLWNHDMPTTGYTMYTSEYLTRAGYTMPTALGTPTAPGQVAAGTLSRQCLSCHDGTVAVGAVYMVRGTILGDSLIAMSGVTADKMPTTATGYIGTNLTKHHPVGIVYNAGITIAFGSGSRTIELISGPTSTDMKLYTISATYYVECSSCHDPHLQNTKFLRDTDGANLAAKISNTCSACHIKTGWSGSIHQSSGTAYSDTAVGTTFGSSTISSLVCMNCHRTHKGLGTPYLLRQAEETTCFQGASSLTTETACHGSSATATTNRIQTVITRAYKHPTTTISGVHTNLDVLTPTEALKGLQWSDSRHAECVDCHNPHRATNSPARVGTASWYPTTVDSTSNLTAKSGALLNVTGVEPGTASIWTVPTTFTTYESAAKEYQICFKCHSYWALRDGDGITTYTTASGATVTDQSMEFNPNNKSAHPVVVGLSSQTGSYAPKPLTASRMSAPWATNLGTQTMYCSDCHGANSENTTDPRGPHGSNQNFMLKGTGQYWPARPGGVLWTLGDIYYNRNSWSTQLFCKNCHPMISGTSFISQVHRDDDDHYEKNYTFDGYTYGGAPCIACHLAVPHGGKRSRFIVYYTDPAPYNYKGNTAIIRGFKKTTSGSYDDPNCYFPDNAGGSGCDHHNDNASGYDP